MNDREIILKIRDVDKTFGATKALQGVCLDVAKGEVHAIVGSNGAGKSTLMKSLSGVYVPDKGQILLGENELIGCSPKQIQELGMETVHQTIHIVASMTVLENILAPTLSTKGGFLTWKEGRKKAEEVFRRIGIDMDLNRRAGTLSVAEQQFVIIARALMHEPKVLILDEPTSRISKDETAKLFHFVRELKKNGTAILYISHRMEEIYEISDTISVFRDGRCVETRKAEDLPQDELIVLMLGKQLSALERDESIQTGEPVLTVNNLMYKGIINDFSFDVKAGEIVSLVGAVGAGKTETLNCIYGTMKRDKGEIVINGKKLPMGVAPQRTIREGIALVPEDRNQHGMFDQSTIRENITSINMRNFSSKAGVIRKQTEKKLAQQISEKMLVKPNDIEYLMRNLSGGNQQKVVIGKWIIDSYSLYLLDEVAAGVDIGAKLEIYQVLRDLARSGAAILLATGDIEEAIALSHRIIVMFKGKIIKEVDPGKTSKEEILNYIMGGGKNEE